MSYRRQDYAGQVADGKVNLQSASARPEHVTVLGVGYGGGQSSRELRGGLRKEPSS